MSGVKALSSFSVYLGDVICVGMLVIQLCSVLQPEDTPTVPQYLLYRRSSFLLSSVLTDVYTQIISALFLHTTQADPKLLFIKYESLM